MTEFFGGCRRRSGDFNSNSISLFMFAIVVLGLYFSFRNLPPIWESPPDLGQGRDGNWVGQTGPWTLGNVVFLLLAAYVAKWLILSKCRITSVRICDYVLVVLLSLPYIWFLCSPEWFDPFIYRIACWIGDPIAIWLIPTVSFLADLSSRPTFRYYFIRSSIELTVVIPIWFVFWTFFSFFLVDFGWI